MPKTVVVLLGLAAAVGAYVVAKYVPEYGEEIAVLAGALGRTFVPMLASLRGGEG